MPFAKHPAYALLLAGAHRLGGVAAMVLLSVAGVVAAAALAGALVARFDPVLRRPAIWTVGLASPLFFDGFLVIGHTLGAALAAGAALCALVAIVDRRPVVALAVAPCVAGAVLLRSEAVLFAGALAVVALVARLRAPSRLPAILVAGAALASAVTARMAEAAWLESILGQGAGALELPNRLGTDDFLQGRLDSFFITWLLPDYKSSQPFSLLLLVMLMALAIAAIQARSAPANRMRVLAPAGIAAGAATGAFVAAPATVVPGLLLAFPAVVAGVLVARRSLFRDPGVVLAAGTSVVFALAVLATQYNSGGTGEWGGRYFALAIPVFVPVLLLALHRQGRRLERTTRRGALAALVVCSLALTSMALLSVRSSHRYWSGVMDSVKQAHGVAGPGAPVMATWSAAPRYVWPILDRSRWVVTSSADVGRLRRSFAELGFRRYLFVSIDVEADRAALAGLDVVWSDGPLDNGRRILVVQESTRPGSGVSPAW